MRLLFVCSGNTCRSPLAVAAWEYVRPDVVAHLGDYGGAELYSMAVTSAGLSAQEGAPAARFSQEIAREWNVDLSRHRARSLTREEAREADLIITMTRDHAATVRATFGVEQDRVRVLGSFAPAPALLHESDELAPLWGSEPFPADLLHETEDILDPYGASLEAYQACANHILACVRALAQTLASEDL